MRKHKGIVISIIAVVAIGIAAGVASFTLGRSFNYDSNERYQVSSAGSIGQLTSCYKTQIQRIIEYSKYTKTDDPNSIDPMYHIVEIVSDKPTGETKLQKYIKDDDFRKKIIGSDMAVDRIDITVVQATKADDYSSAISKADLIYLSCGTKYIKSSNDISVEVKSLLNTYILSDFKPVILDSELVGITVEEFDKEDEDNDRETNAYNLIKGLDGKVGGKNDTGSFTPVTTKTEDSDKTAWNDVFRTKLKLDPGETENHNTNFVTFDNTGNSDWNEFDDDHEFKVLEIVPEASATTSFKKYVETETRTDDDGKKYSEFSWKAFADPVEAKYVKYEQMTVEQFNSNYGNVDNYDFVVMTHYSTDKKYFADATDKHGKLDLSDEAKAALKSFVYKDNGKEGDAFDYVNRFIYDKKFLTVYKYKSATSSSGSVDKHSNMYALVNKLMSDKGVAYINNAEVVSYGYFGHMNDSRAERITNLINRSTYRTYTANSSGTTFKVLEIQAYDPVSTTSAFKNAGTQLTNSLIKPKSQEYYDQSKLAYYQWDMTKARIAEATGLKLDQIDVTTVSSNALNCMQDDVVENFDLVYIGGYNSSLKDESQWQIYPLINNSNNFISYDPRDITGWQNQYSGQNYKMQYNTYLYSMFTHTGDLNKVSDQYTGVTQILNGQSRNSYVRENGNDITDLKEDQLERFIDSGMPVIVEKNVMGYTSSFASDYRTKKAKFYKEGKTDDDAGDDFDTWMTKNLSESVYTINNKAVSNIKNSEIDPDSNMFKLLKHITKKYYANVLVNFDKNNVKQEENEYLLYEARKKFTGSDSEKAQLIKDNKAELVTDTVGTGSSATKIDQVSIFNSTSSDDICELVDAKASLRPFLNILASPTEYSSENPVENDHDLAFQYSIDIPNGAQKKYEVNLWYDYNGDGVFSDSEVSGQVEGTTYASECVASQVYDGKTKTMKFSGDNVTIDESFFGVLPWKVEATEIVGGKPNGRKASYTGYAKIKKITEGKEQLDILQIIPGTGTVKNIPWNDPNTFASIHPATTLILCPDCHAKKGQGLMNHKHTFGILSSEMKNTDKNGNQVNNGFKYADKTLKNLADTLTDYEVNLDIYTTRMCDDQSKEALEDFCKNWSSYKDYYKSTTKGQSEFKSMYGKSASFDDIASKVDTFISKYYNSGSKTISCNSASDYTSAPLLMYAKWLYSKYDMVVLGFQAYTSDAGDNGCDLAVQGALALKAYIKQNGNVLITHDSTSYATENKGRGWAFNISKYLKDDFGMDRFHLAETTYSKGQVKDKSGNPLQGFYEGWLNRDGSRNSNQQQYNQAVKGIGNVREVVYTPTGAEFFTKITYDGTMEAMNPDNMQNCAIGSGGLTDLGTLSTSGGNSIFKDVEASNRGLTSKVLRNNKGTITQYPYTLSAVPDISQAKAQYWALDLENPNVKVWYSLAGSKEQTSSFAAASQLDGRNNYYIYSKGNITYTGAGASDIVAASNNEDERKLFINTMLRAVKIKNNSKPKVTILKSTAGDSVTGDDCKFVSADDSDSGIATLTIPSKSQNKINFDFKIKVSNAMEKIKNSKVFIDKDGDGVYTDGKDYLVAEYEGKNAVVNNKNVQFIGKDCDVLKNASSLFNGSELILTVQGTDDNGVTASNKIKILAKAKLFNLN